MKTPGPGLGTRGPPGKQCAHLSLEGLVRQNATPKGPRCLGGGGPQAFTRILPTLPSKAKPQKDFFFLT